LLSSCPLVLLSCCRLSCCRLSCYRCRCPHMRALVSCVPHDVCRTMCVPHDVCACDDDKSTASHGLTHPLWCALCVDAHGWYVCMWRRTVCSKSTRRLSTRCQWVAWPWASLSPQCVVPPEAACCMCLLHVCFAFGCLACLLHLKLSEASQVASEAA